MHGHQDWQENVKYYGIKYDSHLVFLSVLVEAKPQIHEGQDYNGSEQIGHPAPLQTYNLRDDVDAYPRYYEVGILNALADLFIIKNSVHYDGEA